MQQKLSIYEKVLCVCQVTINCWVLYISIIAFNTRYVKAELKARGGISLMLNKRYHCLRFGDELSTFLFEVNQMSGARDSVCI